MFKQARIKLTLFYASMIMLVSLFFSVVIYKSVSFEFEKGLRRVQAMRMAEDMNIEMPKLPPKHFEQQYSELFKEGLAVDLSENLAEAKRNFVGWLALINGVIFISSFGLGYLVAGVTLTPIQKAHHQQKRFVADASHELRTPLAVMKTSIEVLQRNKKAKLADYKKLSDSLLEEVDNLQDLTANLLSLSSSSINNLPKTEVELGAGLQQVVEKILPLAKSKKININQHLESALVWGNQESLKKLWMILLDNAIKYSPDGGRIDINLEKQKKDVVISIADSGIGIRADELEKIFERFYRADSSRSKMNVPGYGLGLSMAQRIVKAHDGQIRAESGLGQGSRFVVKLPSK